MSLSWQTGPSAPPKIQDGAVTAPKLAAGIIGGGHIIDGEVDTAELADGAVTTPKLADGAVTDDKIADDSVGNPELKPEVQTQLVPGGGAANQVLQKRSAADHDDQWGLVNRPNIHADVLDLLLPTGGTQGQVLKKQSATDGDADWEAEAAADDAATWAEQGNTDPIPRSKLPAEAFTQYTKEHSFTITVAVLGQANEGRGFDRVAGGGGSASGGGVFTLDGQTLTLVAAEQLATGLLTISVHGTPSQPTFGIATGLSKTTAASTICCGCGDASRYVREPGDTSYPAGLRTFQIIEWSAQATNIIFTRSVGSTFTLSLAVDPEEYLADQLAGHTVGTAQIEDGAVTEPKIAAGNITTALLADDAVTQPKIADGAVGADQLANNAVGTAELQDDAVTNDKLDSNAVTTDNLNALAVTTPKIANGAVTVAKLGADALSRLNPMGGAGGQSALDSLVQIVSLWRYSGTTPAASELTASPPIWGPGWTNIPTGWAAPAPTSGVGNRFRATTIATFNETTNVFDLGTWTITQETLFNTQYTADPGASPLVTTSNRVASSRYWRTRDPNTGHWASIWNALYTGLGTWTVLASVPIGVTSKTQERIVTFTQPVRTRRPQVPRLPSRCAQPGAQPDRHLRLGSSFSPGTRYGWTAASTDGSNNYVGGASWAVLTAAPPKCRCHLRPVPRSPPGSAPAPLTISACKFQISGQHRQRGTAISVRFHEWAAINQSGYITFLLYW